MRHGHLSLGDGLNYSGDSQHAWYNAMHQCVLLLSTSCVYMLPLDASLDSVAAATSVSRASRNLKTLYNFNDPEASNGHKESIQQQSRLMKIRLMQLSVDRQFLAIQHSDIEVQVLHRATRTSCWVLCSSRTGNRIMNEGVIWSAHQYKTSSLQSLFLVTKFGLEHHHVSWKHHSCVLHKTVGLDAHNFWYAASHGVLLLSTGSRANEIVPFLVNGENVKKLPKLVFATSVNKQDLRLVTLYGSVYVVYNDPSSTKLLLYLVGRTDVSCVRSFNLMLPPGTALDYSVVDNLLVCHSLEFNVSLFFDIKCDTTMSDPFSAPLPISLSPPCIAWDKKSKTAAAVDILNKFDDFGLHVARTGQENELPSCSLTSELKTRRAPSVMDVDLPSSTGDVLNLSPSILLPPASQLAKQGSARQHQRTISAVTAEKALVTHHEAAVAHFSQWRFHAPNFMQRSCSSSGVKQVEIRVLQLNLAGICKTCEHHPEIVPFLLRRSDCDLAKMLVLKLVRRHIVEQQASLYSIARMLSPVQTTSRNDRRIKHAEPVTSVDEYFSSGVIGEGPSARDVSSSILIQQAELYHHVWKRTLEDTNVATSCNLSICIVEYIKGLRKREIQVENITYLALAECFIATEEPARLYQFLSHHVIADFVELAELMVRNGKTFPALFQAGMDMYFRLDAIPPLLHALLDLGQTEQAIEIAWQHIDSTSCIPSVLPGVAFFDSLVRSVTSSKQPRSSLQVTQMLGHLLHFLKVWDPTALERSSRTSVSRLASCATVPFPDEMVLLSSQPKLKKAFGFGMMSRNDRGYVADR
uniref:Mic1 domain-containing protein n=1 Tax=Peronospora matthiolae TaxID=2874970 RepID=A0AAV1V279_9STRA